LIQWETLPTLIGPRHRQKMAERYQREHLARVKWCRTKRKTHKNHSTNRERAHVARRKAADHAKKVASAAQSLTAYLTVARQYWSGERATHP
jgi:hypothetical protein